MKKALRLCWYVLLACCALHGSALAQTDARIRKIEVRHVGPPAVSDELVKANIRVRIGDVYNKNATDEDIRNLRATGYFYNIRVAAETLPDGVGLTYVVQGRPTLTEIRFEGNQKYRREKLLRKVTSKVGEPLDEFKLFSDAREIRTMYEKAGHQGTVVRYTPSINENTGRSVATFEITEAPRVKIQRVDFPGSEAFSERRLRKVIKTRRHWMFSWLTGSGKLKDDQFAEDKEKLADFYRNEGYIDFELQDVKFDHPKPNRMVISMEISEGKQYKVGSVEFQGNKIFSTNEFLPALSGGRGLQMGEGEVFTPKGLRTDRDAIQDFYWSKGYIDVNVAPLRNANTERGTLDLTYRIDEGDKSYIEKIEIQGNTKTKDRVIRRELAVTPGEVFDMVRVNISKSRLEQMQFFSKVDTDRAPTDIPNRKNLVVSVQEQETGHFDIGAGFSSIESIFGIVGFTQGNFDLFNPPFFTGGGQKLRVYATIGSRQQNYTLSFTEPWFLGRRLRFDFDLYHRDLQYFSDLYDQVETGGRIGFTRALTPNLVAGINYTLERITIDDVAEDAPQFLKDEAGTRLVSKVGTLLAYDTRNSILLPNRGQRTELIGELAGGPFGADTDFYKVEFGTAWYFRGFATGHVLELGGRIGVVDNYDDTPVVPIFDRWFLGGANTLRGYEYRDVGPRINGEPTGGESFWFASVEYSIPIIERLRLAVFYDIGMVYRDAWDFDFGHYNDNVGVGIRLNIPQIGPLRLDYGIPITHDEGTSGSGEFQFNVNYSRPF